jgi:integrase
VWAFSNESERADRLIVAVVIASPTAVRGVVKATLHDLRPLQASMLLDAGEAITVVAARLGHRDTSTTLKVYGHLMPGADERVAGIVGSAFSRRRSGDGDDK